MMCHLGTTDSHFQLPFQMQVVLAPSGPKISSLNCHIICKSNEYIFYFKYLQVSCGSDRAVNEICAPHRGHLKLSSALK